MSGSDVISPDDEPPYKVGYHKPPKEGQFKKGESGNPKGRPPRKVPEKVDPVHEPTMQQFLDELHSPVPLRENDKVIMIPGIVAVARAMKANALNKGSRLAQKQLIELGLKLESQISLKRNLVVDVALKAQKEGRAYIEECIRDGRPEPLLLPHPEDLSIDLEHLTVEVNGPQTLDQKACLDKLIRKRDSARAAMAEAQYQYFQSSDPEDKFVWHNDWRGSLDNFDFFNDRLSGRYKIALRAHERIFKEADEAKTEAEMAAKGQAEDKARWADAVYKRDRALENLAFTRKFSRGVKSSFSEVLLDGWKQHELDFHLTNDALPERYRVEIPDSWKFENAFFADGPDETAGTQPPASERPAASTEVGASYAVDIMESKEPAAAEVTVDWSDCLKERDQAQQAVSVAAMNYLKQSDPTLRERFAKTHETCVTEFDRISAMVPKNLRTELKERWIADAALKFPPPS